MGDDISYRNREFCSSNFRLFVPCPRSIHWMLLKLDRDTCSCLCYTPPHPQCKLRRSYWSLHRLYSPLEPRLLHQLMMVSPSLSPYINPFGQLQTTSSRRGMLQCTIPPWTFIHPADIVLSILIAQMGFEMLAFLYPTLATHWECIINMLRPHGQCYENVFYTFKVSRGWQC